MKFKIYLGTVLFVIMLLLIGLDVAIFYGASKVKDSAATISKKADAFNEKANAINKNLQDVNANLQKQNQSISPNMPVFSR